MNDGRFHIGELLGGVTGWYERVSLTIGLPSSQPFLFKNALHAGGGGANILRRQLRGAPSVINVGDITFPSLSMNPVAMYDIPFSKLLSETEERWLSADRKLSLWNRFNYMHLWKPSWARHDLKDKLHTLFRNQYHLYREGKIVWGHIVQANQLMFDPRYGINCPGEVVYALNSPERADPWYLQEVAHATFSLKGEQHADRPSEIVGRYLNEETIRVFGLPVPPKLCPDVQCYLSSTVIIRKHLPTNHLSQVFFPLLVSPTKPHIAIILPSRFWSPQLIHLWLD